MATAVYHLLTLQRLAESSGDADLAAWLGDGLDSYLFGDLPLEQALNLHADGRGRRPARRLFLEQRRNAALFDAWQCCRCEGDTLWARTGRLVEEIRDFRRKFWWNWRRQKAPPNNASALRESLFWAHVYGQMPGRDQLHRILLSMQESRS